MTLDCLQTQELLHGYLDGELDLVHSVEMEHHLQSCPACKSAYENQQTMRKLIAGGSLYYRAPDDLRKRIQGELRRVNPPQAPSNPRLRSMMSLATAAVLLVAVTWAINRNWPGEATEAVVDQVVAGHVRSLLVDHLADVASSDRHQVKPWFNGKLDYSPEVDDFAPQGFPLIGGRLDYVDHRPVAAMVYGRRKHLINLFCWPATDEHSPAFQQRQRQGYHVVHWTKSGLEFWAVSDLNAAELQQFAQLVQAAGAEPSAD
jgi:mycothiol system anti-sigma-R factor